MTSRNRISGDPFKTDVLPAAAGGVFQDSLDSDMLVIPATFAAGAHTVQLNGTLRSQPPPADGDQLVICDPFGKLGSGTTLTIVGRLGTVGKQLATPAGLADAIVLSVAGSSVVLTYSVGAGCFAAVRADGAAPLAGSVVVFQDGGTSSGDVYATWAEVQSVIERANTPFSILGDGQFVAGIVTVPGALGVIDCKGLVTLGTVSHSSSPDTGWMIGDGTQLHNLVGVDGGTAPEPIGLRCNGVSPLRPLSFSFPTSGAFFFLRNAYWRRLVSADGEMLAVDNDAAFFLTIKDGAYIDNESFSVGEDSDVTLIILRGGQPGDGVPPVVENAVLGGSAGASLTLQYDFTIGVGENSNPRGPFPNFPNYTGTVRYVGAQATLLAVPTGASIPVTADYVALPGELVHVDTSAGSFSVTLPPFADITNGGPVIIKCVALSANPVTILPSSASPGTVDGDASLDLTPDTVKLSAICVADLHADNWDVLF